MSLKAFHIAFIVLSTTLAIGFAAWCFREMFLTGSIGLSILGIVSSACAVALGAYGIFFVRKTKGVEYL